MPTISLEELQVDLAEEGLREEVWKHNEKQFCPTLSLSLSVCVCVCVLSGRPLSSSSFPSFETCLLTDSFINVFLFSLSGNTQHIHRRGWNFSTTFSMLLL